MDQLQLKLRRLAQLQVALNFTRTSRGFVLPQTPPLDGSSQLDQVVIFQERFERRG
jgi:hypothetical protein